MSTPKTPPGESPKGKADAEDRQRRQAEALRANLARRKAQGRARSEADKPESQDGGDQQ